jgi:hypothetical protein
VRRDMRFDRVTSIERPPARGQATLVVIVCERRLVVSAPQPQMSSHVLLLHEVHNGNVNRIAAEGYGSVDDVDISDHAAPKRSVASTY